MHLKQTLNRANALKRKAMIQILEVILQNGINYPALKNYPCNKLFLTPAGVETYRKRVRRVFERRLNQKELTVLFVKREPMQKP